LRKTKLLRTLRSKERENFLREKTKMKKLTTICALVGVLLTASADVKATVLSLNFDGADGATTTVDSSPNGHTPINFFGNAQLDTAEKKSGSASLLLDGSGDYLTIADSPDWDVLADAADDWTIDFWVQQHSYGYQYYLGQRQGGTQRWAIYYENGLGFYSGFGISLAPAEPISDSDWHWIAFCKVADEYAMYKDGRQINYTKTSAVGDITGILEIGTYATMYCFDGRMDKLRITHSNTFDASPNEYKTDTIVFHSPEPATIALLGLGALGLLRRKRKM